MGWLYELISIGSALMTPYLLKLGVPNLHFIDAIVMFLVIPFLHLMNDDETKTIICEENWYQGIRHMLGIYKKKVADPKSDPSGYLVADPKNKSSPSHNKYLTDVIGTNSSQNRFLIRRCNSASSISPSQTSEAAERNDLLQRRYSLRYNITEQRSISFQDPITIYLITSIKAKNLDTTPTTSQSNNSLKRSRKCSMTSLHTLYLDS